MPNATIQPVDPTTSVWSQTLPAPQSKALTSRILYPTSASEPVKALVSLGDKWASKPAHEKREVVRKAVGTGVAKLREAALFSEKGFEIGVDGAEDGHAAAVGAYLALHQFTLKTAKDANPGKDVTLAPSPNTNQSDWNRGVEFAKAQILARELMEMPANLMTPTIFSERIKKEFEGVKNVEVIVRDEAWAREKKMNTFLSVAKGSAEPPKLVEIHYRGAPDAKQQPLVFVGKGITFDSGGISIKPAAGMKLMRGDMGGAATVCSAALAIAKLKVPVNLIVITPLCENLPGPTANKPGDVIYAMNGKTVEVDNTDAEGRLILADALYYASTAFNAHTVVDLATLTGAMQIALGEAFTGVFSTSDSLFSALHASGLREHDRFWRMPLDEEFMPQIGGSNADLCNTGGKPAGSCTAALFLKSFVDGIEPPKDSPDSPPRVQWAHVDIAGTMEATRPGPYQYKGMTGRPVRALIDFAENLAVGVKGDAKI